MRTKYFSSSPGNVVSKNFLIPFRSAFDVGLTNGRC